MSISLKIILDTRRIKKKIGKYPIKLRATFKRSSRNYQTVYDLSVEEYEKLSASRINAELQQVRDSLKEIQRTSENFSKELRPFSFVEFEKGYIFKNPLFKERKVRSFEIPGGKEEFDFTPFEKKFPILKEDQSKPDVISTVYISCVKKLLQEDRIGNAVNYQDSYNSLKKFKGNVHFNEITISYLIQYEQWMRSRNCTKTTIGIKLRHLRAIFNDAIDDGIITDECYPFGRRKYQIPSSRNIKKALDSVDIGKIFYYQPECIEERKAKDYWLFCYFGNGMNPKDLALLKFKNIHNEYLIFDRAKTERTARTNPRSIIVYINEDMQEIIQRWRSKNKNADSYIFPILDSSFTPLEQHFVIKSFVKFINDRMAKIKDQLGIEKKITTIVSRHTFSTQLKRSGASTEFIQEALGHTDKKTTENYLDSFENEVKKEFARKLAAFKTIQETDAITQ